MTCSRVYTLDHRYVGHLHLLDPVNRYIMTSAALACPLDLYPSGTESASQIGSNHGHLGRPLTKVTIVPVQRIVFVPTLSTAPPLYPHQPPVYWFTRDTHPRSSQPDPGGKLPRCLRPPLAVWYAMNFPRPAKLRQQSLPFDDPDWTFELKARRMTWTNDNPSKRGWHSYQMQDARRLIVARTGAHVDAL